MSNDSCQRAVSLPRPDRECTPHYRHY